jgi:hypothetical protein
MEVVLICELCRLRPATLTVRYFWKQHRVPDYDEVHICSFHAYARDFWDCPFNYEGEWVTLSGHFYWWPVCANGKLGLIDCLENSIHAPEFEFVEKQSTDRTHRRQKHDDRFQALAEFGTMMTHSADKSDTLSNLAKVVAEWTEWKKTQPVSYQSLIDHGMNETVEVINLNF